MKTKRILALLLAVVLAVGMLPLSASAASGTFTIKGTVQEYNGTPAAGAIVSLSGPASATTTTAGDGTYSFSVTETGVYVVTAAPDGIGRGKAVPVNIPNDAVSGSEYIGNITFDKTASEPDPTPTYLIESTETEGGFVYFSAVRVKEGGSVNVVIEAHLGYKFDMLLVNGGVVVPTLMEDGRYIYTIQNVYENQTVKAVFSATEEPVHKCDAFSDIKGTWAQDSICYVVENGLMAGVSETTFAPYDRLTRAMVATILWRLDGEPEPTPTSEAPFTDVAGGQYYSKAVAWASENQIISGYDDGTFQPKWDINRQEFASMLYRYAKYKNVQITMDDVLFFTDADSISGWAREGVLFCQSCGVMTGRPGGYFEPRDYCSRAEAASVFERLRRVV